MKRHVRQMIQRQRPSASAPAEDGGVTASWASQLGWLVGPVGGVPVLVGLTFTLLSQLYAAMLQPMGLQPGDLGLDRDAILKRALPVALIAVLLALPPLAAAGLGAIAMRAALSTSPSLREKLLSGKYLRQRLMIIIPVMGGLWLAGFWPGLLPRLPYPLAIALGVVVGAICARLQWERRLGGLVIVLLLILAVSPLIGNWVVSAHQHVRAVGLAAMDPDRPTPTGHEILDDLVTLNRHPVLLRSLTNDPLDICTPGVDISAIGTGPNAQLLVHRPGARYNETVPHLNADYAVVFRGMGSPGGCVQRSR